MHVLEQSHLNKSIPQTIRRIPRRKKPASEHREGSDDALASNRDALEACAFRLIARRKQVRVALGDTFIRIKKTLKHGRWESYFERTFEHDISLRTAERYMRMAEREVANGKNVNMSIFPPTQDAYAAKVQRVTDRAEAKLGAALPSSVESRPNFRLPLVLTKDEQQMTRQLLRSSKWPIAQRRIIRLLRKLHTKFGLSGKEV